MNTPHVAAGKNWYKLMSRELVGKKAQFLLTTEELNQLISDGIRTIKDLYCQSAFFSLFDFRMIFFIFSCSMN